MVYETNERDHGWTGLFAHRMTDAETHLCGVCGDVDADVFDPRLAVPMIQRSRMLGQLNAPHHPKRRDHLQGTLSSVSDVICDPMTWSRRNAPPAGADFVLDENVPVVWVV